MRCAFHKLFTQFSRQTSSPQLGACARDRAVGKHMSKKHSLIYSAAMAVMLSCGAAAAQEAGSTTDDADIAEEIVVTGTARSREDALAQRQNDTRVIAALGVDELGQLPDHNVGESLNRLPGVTMLVEKGEGRYVQVRGVAANLNNVTINGVQMGSPEVEDGGRQAPLDIIAGGVLSRVQVVKTPTPDMDAQGIGGTVNVETAMPFDRPDDFYGYVTARVGYEDTRPESEAYGGHDPYGLEGTVSGRFGENVGWLLGASWSSREYIATGVYQDDWDEVPGADGVFLPQNVKNNYYVIGRERLNLNGALEWRPDANTSYFVRGFYGTWEEFQHRNRYEQNFNLGRVTLTGDNAGTQGLDRVAANIRLEEPEKTIASIAVGGENQLDAWTIDYLVQANQNELSEPNDYWEWRTGSSAVGTSTFNVNGDGVVIITPDAGTPDRTDPSLFPLRRVRFFDRNMEEDAYIAQINATYAFSDILTFKGGLKYSTTDRSNDESQSLYTAGINLAASPDFTAGGFINDNGQGGAPNVWMNIDAMNAYFADNPSAFTLDDASTFSSALAGDYDLNEDIFAGYIMATAELGATQIIGGVRVENTQIDSSGYLLDGSTTTTRVHSSGDYTEALPALLVNYRPTEDWVVRAAVTRAMGRPGYDQIAPRSSYDEDGTVGTLSIGNPDLLPRKSWNYDLSFEWYPNNLTGVSVSLFYKDIEDQIAGERLTFDTQSEMQAALTERGVTGVDTSSLTRLDISSATNAGSATLQGVELNAQSQFDFLPGWWAGFGGSATATFVDGEVKLASGGTAPIDGQAEMTYAFTLFYQRGPIDASISYAYNDSYFTANADDPINRLDQGEFGRWDAKFTYSISDDLKVFVEGANLNDEPTTEFQGGDENRNTEYEYVGRTIYVGASWGF